MANCFISDPKMDIVCSSILAESAFTCPNQKERAERVNRRGLLQCNLQIRVSKRYTFEKQSYVCAFSQSNCRLTESPFYGFGFFPIRTSSMCFFRQNDYK